MAARGEAQDLVLGEHPLICLHAAEAQPLVRVVEWQLDLAPPARVSAALGFGRQPQPHLPQQLTPGEPEVVAPAHPHEVLDPGALELWRRAAHEVAEAPEGSALLALENDRSRGFLSPIANEP